MAITIAGMSDRALWVRRVAAWRASGEPATTFSAGQGFTPTALRYWAGRLAREDGCGGTEPPVRLARVVRVADALSARDGAADSAIVIERGSVRVRVVAGFDRAALRTVLEIAAELESGGGQ